MSKGSKRRPTDYDKFSSNYDKIFKKSVGQTVQDGEMEEAKTGPPREESLVSDVQRDGDKNTR